MSSPIPSLGTVALALDRADGALRRGDSDRARELVLAAVGQMAAVCAAWAARATDLIDREPAIESMRQVVDAWRRSSDAAAAACKHEQDVPRALWRARGMVSVAEQVVASIRRGERHAARNALN